MINVAKMATRYPDFHGEGYYNFLMDEDIDELEFKIENNSHDFSLVGIEEVDVDTIDEVVEKYPSKADLNKALFDVQV